MESQEGQKAPPVGKQRDPRKQILVVIIAAIVVCGALIGYVLYSGPASSKAKSSAAIVAGDQVTMNYIGRFSDGRVFDTSIQSIANNNALYPKSLTFSLRDNSSYKPFNMTAGNYGTGGTIKGFALGVLGLREGDSSIIEVQPADGYPVQANMTRWIELTQEVSAVEVLSVQEFTNEFKTTPVPMAIMHHYFWTWDIQVVEVFAGTVTLRNMPTVGEIVYPFGNPQDYSNPSGWPVQVLDYRTVDGVILIKHHLYPTDVYNVKGKDVDGNTLIVTGYNADNGTFQVGKNDPQTGYNAEIAGRVLLFEVTIVKVTPAA